MSGRMGERGDTPVLFSENLATAYGRTYYQYKSYAKFEFQLSCKMWTGVTTADNLFQAFLLFDKHHELQNAAFMQTTTCVDQQGGAMGWGSGPPLW